MSACSVPEASCWWHHSQSVLELIPLQLLQADTELCSHLSLAPGVPGKAAPCFWPVSALGFEQLLPKERDSQ